MPLINFINSDFHIVFQIMMKYQIDGAESAAMELGVYMPFHLCILLFGGFLLWLFCCCCLLLLLAALSHRTSYFYEKKLDKTSFHKIKLN